MTNYQQNGPDGKMEAEEVSQINYGTEAEAEIELAAAMEASECKICEGVGKVEKYNGFMVPCQECSVDFEQD